MFGFGGISGGTLVNTVGSLYFGRDLNNAAVTSWETFQAAVALLRTPAGHDPASTAWANPGRWAQVEATLATTDTSAPSEEIGALLAARALLASRASP